MNAIYTTRAGKSGAQRLGSFAALQRNPAFEDKAFAQQHNHAQGDRRVGDVKYEGMIAEGVKIDEIDNSIIGEAIVSIAERATDDRP